MACKFKWKHFINVGLKFSVLSTTKEKENKEKRETQTISFLENFYSYKKFQKNFNFL